MSASAMPYWGSPAEVLSILAAITGPSFTAPPVEHPVSAASASADATTDDARAVIRVDRPTVPPDPSRSVWPRREDDAAVGPITVGRKRADRSPDPPTHRISQTAAKGQSTSATDSGGVPVRSAVTTSGNRAASSRGYTSSSVVLSASNDHHR